MSAGAKQQRLPQPEIPETASIPVQRDLIPPRLRPWEHDILKAAWQPDKSDTHTVWVRDTEEVRTVLRKYRLLPEEEKA